MWLALCLSLALSLSAATQNQDLLMPASQEASQDDINSARDYGMNAGKAWIKSEYDLDLDSMTRNNGLDFGKSLLKSEFHFDLDTYSDWQIWRNTLLPLDRWAEANAGPNVPGTEAEQNSLDGLDLPPRKSVVYNVDLRVEEDDDLRVIESDISDIPFGVRLTADAGLLDENVLLKTSLFMPLSWKDEMRAETDMSFPSLALPWMGTLMNHGGFGSEWAWKSTYANRLGMSSVETGLGTQWLKIWELNYNMRLQFGQDNYEESQWLKLGTHF